MNKNESKAINTLTRVLVNFIFYVDTRTLLGRNLEVNCTLCTYKTIIFND